MARNFLKERSSFLNMQGSYRPTLLAIYYMSWKGGSICLESNAKSREYIMLT